MHTLLLLLACTSNGPATATADAPARVGSPVTTAAASTPGGAVDASAVVASWDGGSLTVGELHEQLKTQLTQLEIDYLQGRYQAESQGADQFATEAIIKAEAAKQGITEDALLKREIESKITPPSEAEVEEYYPVIKRQLRNAPLDEVRPQVMQALMQRKTAERAQAYIGGLRDQYKLTVDVPFPDLPRVQISVDDDPAQGPADAKITIVEFGDYECGYCSRAFATVQQVVREYPDQVRVVYRDFPLSFHKRAVPAAVAANCAGDQGKYWEMHNLLMQRQRELGEDDLPRHAKSVGLDMDKFSACMDNPQAHVLEIQKDFEEGQAAGVTGTPAFFVNGIFLSGAQPFEQFKTIIDRELGS